LVGFFLSANWLWNTTLNLKESDYKEISWSVIPAKAGMTTKVNAPVEPAW